MTLLLLFGPWLFAQAEEPSTGQDNPSSEETSGEAEEPFFAFLDAPQEKLSLGLREMATAMDEFFAEERVFYDKTGSYIRLTADSIWEEHGQLGYTGDIKVKLRLPRTEKKLRLTFESDPDEQRDAIDRTLEETPGRAAEEKDYYGGIQVTLGDERKWRLKPSIGVKFSKPVDIFLRLRADRTYRSGNWLFRPSQRLSIPSRKRVLARIQCSNLIIKSLIICCIGPPVSSATKTKMIIMNRVRSFH